MSQQTNTQLQKTFRNTREALELKNYMKQQMKTVPQIAKEGIFELLPQLYLEIQQELENNVLLHYHFAQQAYEEMESSFFFDKKESNPCDLFLNATLIQEHFKPENEETVHLAAMPNQHIYNMHYVTQKYAEQFKRISDGILVWFQMLLPKEQSNTSESCAFLIAVIKELQAVYDDVDSYFDKFIQYYNNRANCVKQIRKSACYDFYQQLMLIDFKELQWNREYLVKLQLDILCLYQAIGNGYDKIRKTGKISKNSVVAGGVIM